MDRGALIAGAGRGLTGRVSGFPGLFPGRRREQEGLHFPDGAFYAAEPFQELGLAVPYGDQHSAHMLQFFPQRLRFRGRLGPDRVHRGGLVGNGGSGNFFSGLRDERGRSADTVR